jgi:hypothetical protein
MEKEQIQKENEKPEQKPTLEDTEKPEISPIEYFNLKPINIPEKELKKAYSLSSDAQALRDHLLNITKGDFKINELTEPIVILQLLGAYGIKKIQRDTERRWNKWFRKIGVKLSEDACKDTWVGFQSLTFLEYVTRAVLDLFGVSGGLRGEYICYAKSIWAICRKRYVWKWVETVEAKYESWKQRKRLNSDLLKILAYTTCKTLAYCRKKGLV